MGSKAGGWLGLGRQTSHLKAGHGERREAIHCGGREDEDRD